MRGARYGVEDVIARDLSRLVDPCFLAAKRLERGSKGSSPLGSCTTLYTVPYRYLTYRIGPHRCLHWLDITGSWHWPPVVFHRLGLCPAVVYSPRVGNCCAPVFSNSRLPRSRVIPRDRLRHLLSYLTS